MRATLPRVADELLRRITDSPVRTVRSTHNDKKLQDLPHIPGVAARVDADGRRTGDGTDARVLSARCPPTASETGAADGADSRKRELLDTVGRDIWSPLNGVTKEE